jgi:hypothetical protein
MANPPTANTVYEMRPPYSLENADLTRIHPGALLTFTGGVVKAPNEIRNIRWPTKPTEIMILRTVLNLSAVRAHWSKPFDLENVLDVVSQIPPGVGSLAGFCVCAGVRAFIPKGFRWTSAHSAHTLESLRDEHTGSDGLGVVYNIPDYTSRAYSAGPLVPVENNARGRELWEYMRVRGSSPRVTAQVFPRPIGRMWWHEGAPHVTPNFDGDNNFWSPREGLGDVGLDWDSVMAHSRWSWDSATRNAENATAILRAGDLVVVLDDGVFTGFMWGLGDTLTLGDTNVQPPRSMPPRCGVVAGSPLMHNDTPVILQQRDGTWAPSRMCIAYAGCAVLFRANAATLLPPPEYRNLVGPYAWSLQDEKPVQVTMDPERGVAGFIMPDDDVCVIVGGGAFVVKRVYPSISHLLSSVKHSPLFADTRWGKIAAQLPPHILEDVFPRSLRESVVRATSLEMVLHFSPSEEIVTRVERVYPRLVPVLVGNGDVFPCERDREWVFQLSPTLWAHDAQSWTSERYHLAYGVPINRAAMAPSYLVVISQSVAIFANRQLIEILATINTGDLPMETLVQGVYDVYLFRTPTVSDNGSLSWPMLQIAYAREPTVTSRLTRDGVSGSNTTRNELPYLPEHPSLQDFGGTEAYGTTLLGDFEEQSDSDNDETMDTDNVVSDADME